jgi:uncharacterized protein YbcI
MAADERNGSTRAAISNEIVRLLAQNAGRGPTRARTYINDDMITCVLEDSLTPVERTLADDGKAQTIEHVRGELQETMREQMVESVEAISGRRVRAFLSANQAEPDVAVETFLLQPRSGGFAPQSEQEAGLPEAHEAPEVSGTPPSRRPRF